MITFTAFKDSFIEEIQKPDFGEPPDFLPELETDALSPGAKELRKKNALKDLTTRRTLRSLLDVLKEYERLANEQDEVKRESQKASEMITRSRNACKTLETAENLIMQVDEQVKSLMNWTFRQHLHRVREEMQFCRTQLVEFEQMKASIMHPAERRKHDKQAEKSVERRKHGKQAEKSLRYQIYPRRVLIKPYDYELGSLKKKAPLQWLIEKLDGTLQEKLKDVRTTTRYRLIAAICKAGKLPPIDPLTIKQHFVEKTKLQKSARISSVG